MRLAPAYRKRLSDFQPDQGAAVSLLFLCDYFIALTFIAPGLVGRVRRSRHPALLRRAALRLPGLQTQFFNASIATRPSGVCSQRGALSVSA
ncbi:hypothetical protein FHN83_17695 [Leclercia adecarboxylata]|nr:hypothetical protein FHN83_17695 [Leclercia adecarboxylata]